jgi:hypothetical protein
MPVAAWPDHAPINAEAAGAIIPATRRKIPTSRIDLKRIKRGANRRIRLAASHASNRPASVRGIV